MSLETKPTNPVTPSSAQPSADPTRPAEPTPTPAPMTPADYLATAVAREDWELPLSDPVRYQQPYRPQFHFSPAAGWLGDPDGMVRFKDLYHVFWWGHAESKDLVHWNERLAPMIGDDDSFVYYSGSVVVDQANTSGFGSVGDQPPMIAVYTMHHKGSNEEDQGLSISYDYKSFVFYDQNPVLDSERPAFRDPQVFWDAQNKRWLMIITLPEDHLVSFYASNDLKQWTHLSDWGKVGAQEQLWEVPDIFQLAVDGDPNHKKWVLLCGMGPNREQYFIGDFDGTTFTLDPALNGFLLRGEGLPGIVYADFENGLPAGWTIEGDPAGVSNTSQLGSHRINGVLGQGFLTTYTPNSENGDRGKTRVLSPFFKIEHNFINFLISGGSYNTRAAVSLLVDGKPVRSAAGSGSGLMKWSSWDVAEFIGKQAQIQMLDDVTGANYGHVNLDHILFSDTPANSDVEHANWLDFGSDYYAVRTYRDYDNQENRVVTMGWLGNWEYANNVPTAWGKGALALPREISLQSYAGGLRIVQKPIPALTGLRQTPVQISSRPLNGVMPFNEFQPTRNTYELELTLVITNPQAQFGLSLVGSSAGKGVTVGYDAASGILSLDRTNSENDSFSPRFAKFLTTALAPQDGKIHLHIYVDQSSIEVFANDGEVSMSALIFPNAESRAISLLAPNGGVTVESLVAWELDSIWGKPAR